MIHFLLAVASAVPVISASDRATFEDYRQCVLSEVRKAPPDANLEDILRSAKAGPCDMDMVATGLEMVANDMEAKKKPRSAVEDRLAVLELELAAEAKSVREGPVK